MDVDLFKKLLDKYITETLSEAERRELSGMLESPAYRSVLEQIMDNEFDDGIYFASEEDSKFNSIYNKLKESRMNTPVIPVGKRRSAVLKWRMPAAAIVLGVLGLSGYFFFNRQEAPVHSPVVQTTPPVNDAIPGRYGAMLTLSDGRTIALDSTASGKIEAAGEAIVVKSGDRLEYSQDGKATEAVYHTLSTAKGEIYSLTLSDGSKVWLNSASSIRFPVVFNEAQREVMVAGEVYLEVAKNEKKKFLVKAGGVTTEVLGTHFNINAYEDESNTAITLLEGSVKIANDVHSAMLQPGQQLKISGNSSNQRRSGRMEVVSDVDLASAVAWKDGYFNFNQADLPAVMRQLTRWYDVEVVYESVIPKRKFGGKMEKDLLLSQVLKLLEKSGIHFRIEENKLIVSP